MVTEFNASLTYSYNFAYGGATTNATIIPPYAPTVLSFIDQVKIFTSNVASKPSYARWTAENAVVGVWMGVNDVGNSFWLDYEAVNARVLDSYFGQLEILYKAGLRKFVLLSVPRRFPPFPPPLIVLVLPFSWSLSGKWLRCRCCCGWPS